MAQYVELSDTWLLNTGGTVDTEAQRDSSTINVEDHNVLKVTKTVKVERLEPTTSS